MYNKIVATKDYLCKNKDVLFSLAFILFCILYLFIRFAFVFSTNYSVIQGESPNVWNIIQMLDGRAMYINPSEMPYEIFMYAPIPQMIYFFFTKILAVSDFTQIYILCRGISLLWNILSVVIVYRLFVKCYPSLQKGIAFWLSCLPLFVMTMLLWNTRVDSCSVTMMIIAVVLSVYYVKTQSVACLIFSSLFTSVAFYCKQDAFQLMAIIPFALFCIRKFKGMFIYIGGVIVFTAFFYGLFYLCYGNQFVQNVFLGPLNNTPLFSQLFYVFNRYTQFYTIFPFVVIAISFLVFSKFEKEKDDLLYMAVVALSVFVFATGISLKAGSGISYYTLFNTIGVLLIGIYFSYKRYSKTLFKFLYLLFVYIFFTGYVYHYVTPIFTFSNDEVLAKQEIYQSFSNEIEADSYIYTDDSVLRLLFYKQSTFPNTEYYPDSQFDYSGVAVYRKKIYCIVPSNSHVDYVMENILQIKSMDEMKLIKERNGFQLYKLTE